jgi:NADPH-dependent 2,4-dienoyl-CoA reductase/sulfur reductase-like enzyme
MGDRIVVVGGGVAAQRCAFALRRLGHEGQIEIVSAEAQPPYDRTLLSKDLLAMEALEPCVALAAEAAYAEAGIGLRLGVRATGLDPEASRLTLSGGETLAFDRLVACTGGRPVLPEALRATGVLTLRDASDLPRVHDALARVRHLVIIGGGFIGGEVASAAIRRHAPVTLVEASAAPLAPVLGDEVAGRLADLHRAAGVHLVCGTPVEDVRRERDGYRVVLADGRELWADAVLAGVGMAPEVEWLDGSGVALDDGIVTDATCRTSRPDVLAAGDCARWAHPGYGEHVRIEHWDVAMRHGEAAAAAALGSDEPFAPLPYFWSD